VTASTPSSDSRAQRATSLTGTALSSDSFDQLLLSQTPLIDVRAESEFAAGHIPGSINLPILNDEERSLVGTCYKQRGQDAAIELGNELVNGDSRTQRIAAWQHCIDAHDGALITCFRGGLRSKTAQAWLADAGVNIVRVDGGFKALRTHLLNATQRIAANKSLIIVGGKTGSGKTHLINALTESVDLEGLANHRGSAFGRRASLQPAQVVFENRLGIALLQREQNPSPTLFLEDESRAIGSISLPLELHRAMTQAPLVSIEESLDFRVETILNDYIVGNLHDFINDDQTTAAQRFEDSLLGSLDRIRKRLGNERHAAVSRIMHSAISHDNDLDQHREWITLLLTDYYDPMYAYQMEKKASRVVFRGNSDAFLSWAKEIDN
jgi:tRNA 2-selenouridine synthase